jgi:hypothetical protein
MSIQLFEQTSYSTSITTFNKAVLGVYEIYWISDSSQGIFATGYIMNSPSMFSMHRVRQKKNKSRLVQILYPIVFRKKLSHVIDGVTKISSRCFIIDANNGTLKLQALFNEDIDYDYMVNLLSNRILYESISETNVRGFFTIRA